MERYTMFLDWKNQHSKNDYSTQGNLHIQCNPYPITNGIFTELEQKIFKFIWRQKRTQIGKYYNSIKRKIKIVSEPGRERSTP